jgi:hypothetical protein
MKRNIIIILALLSLFSGVSAQNLDQALKYSNIYYGGTARFMSMGGAFTALGGDISTLSQNPAGLGVFRSSELSITPQLSYNKSTASFYGSNTEYLNDFNLYQAGLVSNLISSSRESGLLTLNFGYSFNKTNNFDQNIRIQGVNPESSMADYWAGKSEGTLSSNLSGPEGIAYETWVIDTLTGSGARSYGTVFSNYGDNPPSVYGQSVRRLIYNEGYSGEHAISIGGNYSNKLYFGATFGISSLRYVSHYEHLETANKAMPSQFKSFNYTDYYEDKGTGYSFKLGAIFKPVESVRIGLGFHSPVWYYIHEYFFENMTSTFTDGANYEFSNDPLRFDYGLATPMRLLAGVAIQIKKFALLSADYEFVDYKAARFFETGDGYNYSDENRNIDNSLKTAHNFRVGGELRLNKLYLRSGFGYNGKPYNPNEENANLDYTTISGGIGFREQNVFVDFGYSNLRYSEKYIMYPLPDSFDPAIASLNTTKNMFTLTLGYKFGY